MPRDEEQENRPPQEDPPPLAHHYSEYISESQELPYALPIEGYATVQPHHDLYEDFVEELPPEEESERLPRSFRPRIKKKKRPFPVCLRIVAIINMIAGGILGFGSLLHMLIMLIAMIKIRDAQFMFVAILALIDIFIEIMAFAFFASGILLFLRKMWGQRLGAIASLIYLIIASLSAVGMILTMMIQAATVKQAAPPQSILGILCSTLLLLGIAGVLFFLNHRILIRPENYKVLR